MPFEAVIILTAGQSGIYHPLKLFPDSQRLVLAQPSTVAAPAGLRVLGLGVEVKQGKYLAFKIPGSKKFIRCSSLGEDYTEAAIMERISGKRAIEKAAAPAKPNLLIDIQARMRQAHSPGLERWAKVFNLKEMAKPVLYLQENGLTDFEELAQACDAANV